MRSALRACANSLITHGVTGSRLAKQHRFTLPAGTTALSDASLVPALLPLLGHHNPAHLTLVASTVRILESFMDYK